MDGGRSRRRHRIGRTAATGLVLAIALAGCSGTSASLGTAPGTAPASVSPETSTSPPKPTPSASAPATPSPTETPAAPASPSPSTAAGGCPALPVDLASVRDTARAKRAIACFGSEPLTFRAYVPTITDLGGVSGSKMTPAWIADNWTGAILQPRPLADQDQDAWLIVRVPPSLGRCAITEVTATDCPFGSHLEGYVTVTGHFDDPVATKCKSVAFSPELDPGPSKSKMVARCRTQFVLSAIKPG